MRFRWLTRSQVALLALAAAVVTTPPPAGADPRDDLDQVEREVAEAAAVLENATERAQVAVAEHAAAKAELPAARQRLAEAQGAVIAADVAARSAQREAEQAQSALTAASGRYQESVAAVERAREQAKGFASAAYKSNGLTGFNLIVRADGPAQVAERFGFLDQVGEAMQAALAELAGARLVAHAAEDEAAIAHLRAEQARQDAELALAEAEAVAVTAEAAAAEAEALAETAAEALAVAESEQAASLRRYEAAEAEAARVEQELREWEAAQRSEPDPPRHQPPPPSSAGARLLMPTQGWLSSPFGNRYDPYFGVWQLHAGVDIAAGGGTPIYAAEAGTVIRAGWSGGYGNFTCVGHGSHQGQGFSTCYAHQSAILVSPGQWVGRGGLIGRVGTTGASTGHHLHFEVRLDGTPTNPIPFLPPF